MLRWKLLGAVGLLAMTVAVFVLWPRPDRITETNYARIRAGMSRVEVEAILGTPGDYGSGPEVSPVFAFYSAGGITGTQFRGKLYSPTSCIYAEWLGETLCVQVGYDDSGRVDVSDADPITREKLSPLDSLRWRVERQWRKWFPE
jgi:hypothetical protein